MSKLLLIDGHSILNRAFYGLPDLTNQEGIHTNAILGFLNILFRIMDEEKPSNIAVAFDLSAPTFRHVMYKEYKGTRKPMPEELRQQVPLLKEVLKSMNICIIQKEGYEADDIIGTMSRRGFNEGYEVTIISGDRDLLQLATDKILVRIPKTKVSGTIIENYYEKDVLETYQVTPSEFIDLKGLMGDQSDNIPGVKGVGEKTATKLMTQYHSIENIYEHIDEITPNGVKLKLIEDKESAFFSKTLATIKLDCVLDVNMDSTNIENMFNKDSYELYKRFEFKSLLKKFDLSQAAACELEFTTNIVCDMAEYDSVINDLMKCNVYGVDLVISNNRVLGICLAYNEGETVFVKCQGFLTDEYILDRFNQVLNMDSTAVFMNLKEALPYIKIKESTKGIFDASLGAYLLNPLKDTYYYDDIARDFLNATVPSRKELADKLEVNEITIDDENVLQCLSYDAYIPFMAYEAIKNKINEKEMDVLYYDIELPCLFALYDMERWGIRVDKESLKEYGDKLIISINKLEQEIFSLAGEKFNINSPKQLGEILFDKMGLPNGKKMKSGYSTAVDVLEKLKKDYPIVDKVLDYRQLSKLNSTYAQGLANFIRDDGRIHGKFNQTITATGRISSTDPNLQNIPVRMPLGREIRKVFIPEDGYVFLDADYSQIELRVLAHLSGDENLIKAFNENKDIHTSTASWVFGVPMDEVTSLLRRRAKAVNFGIVYGISAFGLSEDLDISRKEASDYISKYFETFTGIKTFLDETVVEAKKNLYVKTMFNRVRPIPELSSNNFMTRSFGERVAMNSPIQGTAADIIKIAMVNVNMELKEKELKSRLILQIHDELIVETSKDEIEIVKEIMTRNMMNAAKLKVSLDIDINEGSNWYEAK